MFRVFTIGGYGFKEDTFFERLKRAGVDTFVDVRQRRGLRARRYAFLNSQRLQQALSEVGIRYIHLRDLAPTQEIRDLQREADVSSGIAKRERVRMSPQFVDAYSQQVLARFDVMAFRAAVGDARAVAFFCVEGRPEACHRSLVAHHLGECLTVKVEHLQP